MFQLVSKSGANKGAIWAIDGSPITIGRDNSCDVHVPDNLVSRRHCQVVRNDDRLLLVDLGSRNSTLVNGRPANNCELRAGDEIAVGSERFLVTTGDSVPVPNDLIFKPDSTISLGQNDSECGNRTPTPGHNHTVHELLDFFSLSREMWSVSTIEQVAERFAAWIEPRFAPGVSWMVHPDELSRATKASPWTGTDEGGAFESLRPFLRKAADSQIALWGRLEEGPRAGHGFLCVPMSVGPRRVRALGLIAQSEDILFEDSDSQSLAAASQIVAPVLLSMERIEQLGLENEQLRRARPDRPVLLGKSRAITQLRSAIRKAGPSELSVLIEGETGSGKEVVARLIHDFSPRADAPFVALNCAAIPRELFESELFGFERGAFTGAVQAKPGLIETSNGGTLFLDEVGELSPENQARLLRVLETRRFRRVGGNEEVDVDIRIVSATNRVISHEIRSGGFRQDLFYRLSGIVLRTPPLRERPSDIPELVQHFFELARKASRNPIAGFTPDALEELTTRRWNGNVRELRATVERAVAVANGPYLETGDLRGNLCNGNGAGPVSLEEVERRHIEHVLDYTGWRISETARVLKIGRTTLYEKLARYGLRSAGKRTKPVK